MGRTVSTEDGSRLGFAEWCTACIFCRAYRSGGGSAIGEQARLLSPGLHSLFSQATYHLPSSSTRIPYRHLSNTHGARGAAAIIPGEALFAGNFEPTSGEEMLADSMAQDMAPLLFQFGEAFVAVERVDPRAPGHGRWLSAVATLAPSLSLLERHVVLAHHSRQFLYRKALQVPSHAPDDFATGGFLAQPCSPMIMARRAPSSQTHEHCASNYNFWVLPRNPDSIPIRQSLDCRCAMMHQFTHYYATVAHACVLHQSTLHHFRSQHSAKR